MAVNSSPDSVADLSTEFPGLGLTFPWAKVVQSKDVASSLSSGSDIVVEQICYSNDGSSETVASSKTERHSSDQNNGNGAGVKKPAWNKPLNGVVESSSVMGGAAFWPALSESTKPTLKSSPDASKSTSDGPAQAPLMSETLQLQINSNANANSTTNHGLPRQRSMRHRVSGGGSSGGPAQVGYNRSPPPPPPLPPSFPAMGLLPPYGTYVAPILDTPSVRGVRPMGGFRPQSGSDQSQQPQRSPSRRNGFGPRPRGDHIARGRHRVSPPFTPGPYIPQPPPGSASFIAPPNMRPFTPMGYDMTSPYMIVPTLVPEPFRGLPFIPQAHVAPMFYPNVDMHLPSMIVKQIDYYFSDTNLERDNYLKSNMDEEGWVPIDLIAKFPRVQQMTSDIQMILESLRSSTVVEVQGNKIRRRDTWSKWVDRITRTSAETGSRPTPTVVLPSSEDSLTVSIQRMSLNIENSSGARGSENNVGSQ